MQTVTYVVQSLGIAWDVVFASGHTVVVYVVATVFRPLVQMSTYEAGLRSQNTRFRSGRILYGLLVMTVTTIECECDLEPVGYDAGWVEYGFALDVE